MEKKICRERKFAATTSNSSCNSVNNKCNGSKRDSLADLTNSLIPTEVLLDLCSNTISTSKAHDLLRRSQSLTFPISKNFHISKSDSKSDTSIGSSNFNGVRHFQNATPVRGPLSNSSSANLGNEGCKLAAYTRRQTLENLEGPRKIDSELLNSTPVKKKKKDEAKLIPVRSTTTPSYKAKDKQKAVAVPLDLIHSEIESAKEKIVAVPLSLTSLEKLKDKVKAIARSRSSTSVEKLEDKGKATTVPFSSTSAQKGKNKWKAVAETFSHLNEQAEDEEKSTAMLINCPLNKKERRNVNAAISSCPPFWRTRSIRDKLNEADDAKQSKAWSDPHPMHKKRRCSEKQTIPDYSLSQEFEKQKAYFQEIDAFDLPVEEVSSSDLD